MSAILEPLKAHHDTFADHFACAVQSVAGNRALLHAPVFAGNEFEYLRQCIEDSQVSTRGKFIDRFEADLASYVGAKHVIATSSGTAALHVALRTAGVREGHVVMVPALTFAATAAAVVYCGATPLFVESDSRTLGIDVEALRCYLRDHCEVTNDGCWDRSTHRVIKVIVAMHTFGHPMDIEALVELANEYQIVVVEDAAQSLGSWVGDRHTGTFGAVSAMSFNGNKTITTGGGGAIVTDDDDIAREARHLISTAKVAHKWEYTHDCVGYNYRMPNINAAIGVAQLERLDSILVAQHALYRRYIAAFDFMADVSIFKARSGCKSNYWLQAAVLDSTVASERDAILDATHAIGIETRPVWTLLHKLEPYRRYPRMPLPVAEDLERRLINLPSGANV